MSYLEKVSQINNDPSIYGTFAEIGAAQEVAHAFFQVGHASSTIAKTMSAYDMKFSDAIYGEDDAYVCRSRLLKMLAKEYELIRSRLAERADHTRFFVFADTVATGSRRRKVPGHGWLGVTFQHEPGAPTSQIVAHIRFLPRSPLEQHRIVGEIGVNILYACFHHYNSIHDFLASLTVDLDHESLEVDYIEFTGEVFAKVNPRLVMLELLRHKLTQSIIFDENGQPQPPSVHLYGKHVIATQGSFRPLTHSKWTMMQAGHAAHCEKHGLKLAEVVQVAGLSLADLYDEQDSLLEPEFHLRIELLARMQVCVLISDFTSDFMFIQHLNKHTHLSKALVVGAHSLRKVLDESHYHHLTGGLLEALGMMVSHNTTFYIFPVKFPRRDLLNAASVFLNRNKKMLLDYMSSVGLCCEIATADHEAAASSPVKLCQTNNPLTVEDYYSSAMIRDMMAAGQDWYPLVPAAILDLLKQHQHIWVGTSTSSPPLNP